MGWFEELKQTLGEAIRQVTTSTKGASYRHIDTRDIRFTNNFYQKAKAWRLSEKDAEDVFYHGKVIKQHMMVRKYNGYEIGIWYLIDKHTGQPVITSIWKRSRR